MYIEIIYRIIQFLDKQILRNINFSFIYLYLIYCVEVWGNTYDTHPNPIIKIKKL